MNAQTSLSIKYTMLRITVGTTTTHLVMWLRDSAMAYSATTVLPAEVCAATKTFCLDSICNMACFWKVSSSKGY